MGTMNDCIIIIIKESKSAPPIFFTCIKVLKETSRKDAIEEKRQTPTQPSTSPQTSISGTSSAQAIATQSLPVLDGSIESIINKHIRSAVAEVEQHYQSGDGIQAGGPAISEAVSVAA